MLRKVHKAIVRDSSFTIAVYRRQDRLREDSRIVETDLEHNRSEDCTHMQAGSIMDDG